jgi:DNA polymerase-3 subunit epsilon
MNVIVFDTEYTDLVPGQICQISYLIVRDGQVRGKNMFFAVDSMSEGARDVHGMSVEDLEALSGGEVFAARAAELFEDFSRADLLVGHNVAADDRYLRAEFSRLAMPLKKIKTFCTMNYFTGDAQLRQKVNTGRPKPPKLSELIEYFALSGDEVAARADEWFSGSDGAPHDARYDAAATYLCLLEAVRRGMVRGVLS